MDMGTPLIEYHAVDVAALRDDLAAQGPDFWLRDRRTRTILAGDRPGEAVFFYSHDPSFAGGHSFRAVKKTGTLRVLRSPESPLFDAIDRLVSTEILPLYPACDVLRVQLADLPPGAEIAPHTDAGLLTLTHRVHIPIATNDAVRFVIGERTFRLGPGVICELNNAVPHSVHNDGETGRVHLLVDLLPHTLGRAVYFDSRDALFLDSFKAGEFTP